MPYFVAMRLSQSTSSSPSKAVLIPRQMILDLPPSRTLMSIATMKPRIRWTCPGCDRAYSVISTDGLTLCPTCKEQSPPDENVVEPPSIPIVIAVTRHPQRHSGSGIVELLDLRFQRYLTPWIVRLTWSLVLAGAALLTGAIVFENVYSLMSGQSFFFAIARDVPAIPPLRIGNDQMARYGIRFITMLVYIMATAFTLLYVRVFLEGVIVLFNIAATLTKIHGVAEGISRRTGQL